MIKNPLITVIIPNYNCVKFIGQAIESVLEQTYSNLEILVVDDNSTDNSLQIIESYCKLDNRIRLIRLEENKGVANARNIAIAQARGEYVAFIDSDDIWVKDKLERQLKLANAGADLVYASCDFIDDKSNVINKPYIVSPQTSYKKILAENVISCSSVMIRTKIIKQHPFSDVYYVEDYVLWLELLGIPIVAKGDQKVLMHYRLLYGSRSWNKIEAAKNRWKVYRKFLKLNFLTSTYYFICYAINGIRKYLPLKFIYVRSYSSKKRK